ncbi:MAG: hypothetical protein HC853_06080, partial [Anaerolineae bacterium]|nr:hypothetical protein [Anaerolineae bacterium]
MPNLLKRIVRLWAFAQLHGYLSLLGLPTPSESGGTKHNKKRSVWSGFTIHWILRNEIYVGIYR